MLKNFIAKIATGAVIMALPMCSFAGFLGADGGLILGIAGNMGKGNCMDISGTANGKAPESSDALEAKGGFTRVPSQTLESNYTSGANFLIGYDVWDRAIVGLEVGFDYSKYEGKNGMKDLKLNQNTDFYFGLNMTKYFAINPSETWDIYAGAVLGGVRLKTNEGTLSGEYTERADPNNTTKTGHFSLNSKSYYKLKVLGRIGLAYNFGPSYSLSFGYKLSYTPTVNDMTFSIQDTIATIDGKKATEATIKGLSFVKHEFEVGLKFFMGNY